MRIPTATLGLAALAAAVLQGVNAFLLPSAPRSSTTSSTTSVVARVPQQQVRTRGEVSTYPLHMLAVC